MMQLVDRLLKTCLIAWVAVVVAMSSATVAWYFGASDQAIVRVYCIAGALGFVLAGWRVWKADRSF